MIINRTEKQLLAEPGEKVYIDLEALIMQNIVRHVKNYDQLIASDTWLLQKLAEIGKLDKENKEIISKAAGLSQTAVKRMLEETVAIVMERVEPGLTELERQGIIEGAQPAKKSKNVKEALKAVRRQALSDLNLCNTTMLYMAKGKPTPNWCKTRRSGRKRLQISRNFWTFWGNMQMQILLERNPDSRQSEM